MDFDQEMDFKSQQWKLLALVIERGKLRDGSRAAIKADFDIDVTRELIRSYETLKGYWSKPSQPAHPRHGRSTVRHS